VGQYIATPVWHWGVFYEKAIRNLLVNFTNDEYKPMQFWWGLDSGIVDIMYAKKYVPMETHKLVQMFKAMMMEESFNPFTGSILDTEGVERIRDGETASVQDIIGMDWFVQGVHSELQAMNLPTDITSGVLEM
jgi:basic membrane lipoprotein Med (substrate-binding protein (PBP1-ABC) superfamily)